MSEAFFHRSVAIRRRASAASARPLPIGFGLLIGALASTALWGGLVVGFLKVFG